MTRRRQRARELGPVDRGGDGTGITKFPDPRELERQFARVARAPLGLIYQSPSGLLSAPSPGGASIASDRSRIQVARDNRRAAADLRCGRMAVMAWSSTVRGGS